MDLTHLQCDHQTEPKGITASPCFSWKLISGKTGTNQAAYRLRILADGHLVYDSGRVDSSQSIEVQAPGFSLFRRRSTCGKCAHGTITATRRRRRARLNQGSDSGARSGLRRRLRMPAIRRQETSI